MAQALEKKKTAAANDTTAGEHTSAVKSVPFPAAGGNLERYINSIYEASSKARAAQLEAAYNQSIADYNAAAEKSKAAYEEQKRQTVGESEQQRAGFRELANAHGLNSGAVGQAALMQNNQLQGDLAALGRAQAASMADIDMQKNLLEQNHQLQMQQAMAENEYARNSALYNEAVRMAAVRQQEEQFNAQMNLNRLQMAMSQAAKQTEKESRNTGGVENYDDEVPKPGMNMEDQDNYDLAVMMLEKNGFTTTPLSPQSFYRIPTLPYDNYHDYLTKYLEKRVNNAGGT